MTDESGHPAEAEPFFEKGVPTELELAAGATIRLPLPSAAGAGYSWSASCASGDAGAARLTIEIGPLAAPAGEPTNAPLAAPAGEPTNAPPAAPAGEPTNALAPVVLVAEGLRAGEAAWRLVLARVWMPDQPLVDRAIRVTVL